MANGKTDKRAVAAVGIGAGLLFALALSRRPAKAAEAPSMPKAEPLTDEKKRIVALAAKYAGIFGAPTSLLLAIFQIESAMKPDSVNLKNPRGGAWGLGQMTLETAKDLTKRFPATAKRYWPKFDGTGQSLLDIETNIAICAYHLSLLWKRYKDRPGNWLTAGLAWHQGSGNIDKQIAAGKGKVVPSNLPPKGRIYYGWLQRELTQNPLVAKAVTGEQESGKFAYA